MPPRWAVIVGGYAAVYATVAFAYPLATGESLLHTAYYSWTGRPTDTTRKELCEG